jgi:4-amino-4-deoxy-L-arabinose transferase-like glycosyltransferase
VKRPPDFVHWLPWIPLLPLSLLVAWGLLALLRSGERLVPLYAALTLGLICLTPWPGQFPRYLMPLTPLLAAALLSTLAALRVRRPRVAAGVLAAVLAVQGFAAAKAFERYFAGPRLRLSERDAAGARLFFSSPVWTAYHEALLWLRDRAAPGEVIATSWPHWAHLITGKPCVLPPMEADPDAAQALLDGVPARYLVTDRIFATDESKKPLSHYAELALARRPELWAEVHASPDGRVRVYRRAAGR